MGTAIEWTDETWNPVTGCTKVSPGCDHCYAERVTERWSGKGSFAEVKLHPERLDKPLHWRKPRKVFVNSMSDLFHEQVPDEFIAKVFAVMSATPRHTFQILTKRHARMRSLLSSPQWSEQVTWEIFGLEREARIDAGQGSWHNESNRVALPLPNVWLGVSVEDQKWADIRIPALLDTPAAVRFLSCEPLLGTIDLSTYVRYSEWRLSAVDWVIVGGESGPGARPMDPAWATSLRDQCTAAGVPFLFKQHGGHTPKAGGRELHGRTWDEYPETRVTV